MRILWMSDSPTSPSGFGNVTRFVCAGLAEIDHQVSILGWQAHGQPELWNNCTLYPMRYHGFGADVLLSYLRRIQPHVLVTLADIWWLTFINEPVIANFMRAAGIPWVLYYPVDGDMGGGRLPPSWVRVLQTVHLPIAMSLYGRDVTRINGVAPAYIPHGVDTAVFRPPANKDAAKRALGYEGHFVVLSDARNQPRKLLPRTLEIFRRFAAGRDDVLLHLHCDPRDPAAQTPEYYYDLRSDIEFMDLKGKVRVTAGMSMACGISLAQLAAIYQAADVHLLSSWGEGFGLPTLQAASAGVVPLGSDYTATRELVLGHGEAIRVSHFVRDSFGLQRAFIDIDDAVSKLEALYTNRGLLRKKAEAARTFAETYDWSRVVPQWRDLLEDQVPRLRMHMHYPTATSQVVLNPQHAAGRSDLTRVVRQALHGLPENAQLTINVAESKAGELTVGILQDFSAFKYDMTIPVSLPPADAAVGNVRVPGLIYLASPADVPIARQLSRIFPGLQVWSTVVVDWSLVDSEGKMRTARLVQRTAPHYSRFLGCSTLALDVAGVEPDLPAIAARSGVPCIALDSEDQALLWPALALATPDADAATALARWMLTDQGATADICVQATARLVKLVPSRAC